MRKELRSRNDGNRDPNQHDVVHNLGHWYYVMKGDEVVGTYDSFIKARNAAKRLDRAALAKPACEHKNKYPIGEAVPSNWGMLRCPDCGAIL